jgi:hypothetical protein
MSNIGAWVKAHKLIAVGLLLVIAAGIYLYLKNRDASTAAADDTSADDDSGEGVGGGVSGGVGAARGANLSARDARLDARENTLSARIKRLNERLDKQKAAAKKKAAKKDKDHGKVKSAAMSNQASGSPAHNPGVTSEGVQRRGSTPVHAGLGESPT